MTKTELREIYLQKRSLLSADEQFSMSQRIAERFFANIDLPSVRCLHTFIPIKKFKEVDTTQIYERVWKEFSSAQTAAPRLGLRFGGIKHLVFDAKTELVENQWGIPEPSDGVQIEETLIDVVIVPLLCMDRRGFRVGYGKGLYDKFLAQCRPDCLKVGVSFFPPEDGIEDVDEYDIRLDLAITQENVFRFDR